jgi:hypothetical protein
MESSLLQKASTLNTSDATQIKEFNELRTQMLKTAFPEAYKKTELPQDEFTKKITKLNKASHAFKIPKTIKNYTK